MSKIDFTVQEADVLNNLLDLALKKGGLSIAQDVLYFNQKLNKVYEKEGVINQKNLEIEE